MTEDSPRGEPFYFDGEKLYDIEQNGLWDICRAVHKDGRWKNLWVAFDHDNGDYRCRAKSKRKLLERIEEGGE